MGVGGADLDDAFADFLKEVGGDEGGEAPEAPAPLPSTAPASSLSSAKRAAAEAEAEEGGAAKAARKEEPPLSRRESAESLRKAAFQGKLEVVKEILDRLPVAERLLLIDDTAAEDGYAALHLAVIEGHVGIARLLVRRRADVDLPTRNGDTPLIWAAEAGATAMCKELLHLGADAGLKNGTKSASLAARKSGHNRIWNLLQKHAADLAESMKRAESKENAAQARRAANAAMVAQAVREAKEKEEEEAFWSGVRERKARREAAGEGADDATFAAYSAAKASADRAAAALAAEDEAKALATLPPRMQPHYRALDVPAEATEAEVRKAYRRLALKHHPDKNPGDLEGAKERFTKLAVAYDAVCEYLASPESAPKGGARFAPPSSY